MVMLAKILAVLSIIAMTMTGVPAGAVVATGQVVINEIHYHPSGDDDELREFIELYNPGGADIDLTGMAFDDAVTSVPFEAKVLTPGEYLVIAPEENDFEATYGFAPDALYDGKLKNSSETIVLRLGDAVIDQVTYTDGGNDPDYPDNGDWAKAADGNGPSLELTDPLADNARAENWHASNGNPTPRGANTEPPLVTVEIKSASIDPLQPTSADPVTVTAAVEGSSDVHLHYVVGFGSEVTKAMAEVGDGLFSATIDSQDAGDLVRYRITASDEGDSASLPDQDDSITYLGYVVQNPDATTGGAPVFEWFMAEADYQDMMAKRETRDLFYPAVFAYDGTVFDNVTVEIRGGSHARRNHAKQSFNFEMPSGYDFEAPDLFDYPVDEFAMLAEAVDDYFGKAQSSWWIFEQAGFPKLHSFGVRLQRNGEFDGAYRFQEKPDGTWRKQHGYDEGEFYKAVSGGFHVLNRFDKKLPDDGDLSRPNEVYAALRLPSQSDREQYLFDNFDIPNLINYAAAVAIVDHDDSKWHNYYAHFDFDGDERWKMLTWDMDLTFGLNIGECRGLNPTTFECMDDRLMNTIYDSPTLGAMFWARVATLTEQYLYPDTLEQLHDQRVATMGATVGELEKQKWSRQSHFANPDTIRRFKDLIELRREAYRNEDRVPTLSSNPGDVVITEILPTPADDDGAEILELANTGSKPVDLSGWSIDAVSKDGWTIPGGTILLPGRRIVLTDSIPALTATYPDLPRAALVQYSGGLKKGGEKIELVTPDGTVADTVAYFDSTDWPSDLAKGVSLELISSTTDNAAGANWAEHESGSATPGRRNSVEEFSGSTISVIAKGTTGEEQGRLIINGGETFNFDATTSFQTYTFNTEHAVETASVHFLNNKSTPVDRNLHIDAIIINDTRYESEDPSVMSLGSYNPSSGCAAGNKQSQILHCNGYFEYQINPEPGPGPNPGPTPGPVTGDTEVTVIAWGTTGEEQGRLIINDETFAFNATKTSAEYTFSTDTAVEDIEMARVYFLNNKSTPVDRNLHIDAIIINDTRYESEDPSVMSLGSYNRNTGCAAGNKQSQILHCNGYFEYQINPEPGPGPNPGPTPGPVTGDTEVTVIAWGTTGEEQGRLIINDETFAFNATKTSAEYTFSTDTAAEDIEMARVYFLNNKSTPVDRNLHIDAIIINDTRYESEDPSVMSLGSYNRNTGCAAGNKQSQILHCNGYFQYQISS